MTTTEYDYQDDFDLENDYKVVPLIPQDKGYKGNVTGVSIDGEKNSINFTVILQGNDGRFCSDAETPVDGQSQVFKLWMPRPGDEDKSTASGKQSKRQWKINQMKEFFDSLKINAPTLKAIRAQIEDGSWLFDNVTVDIGVETYQGNSRNQIDKLYR